MKTMRETTSTTWTKLAEIATNDFTVEGIYNAIVKTFGEELYEFESIEKAIAEGFIEICADGFIVWVD